MVSADETRGMDGVRKMPGLFASLKLRRVWTAAESGGGGGAAEEVAVKATAAAAAGNGNEAGPRKPRSTAGGEGTSIDSGPSSLSS